MQNTFLSFHTHKLRYVFYVAFTVHFCLSEQFIPTNAHIHIMSIVSFINSFPQYVFRRAYIAIFRGSKFFNIVTLLDITMAVTMYFINIGLC
jgi:hypothetical protein